MAKNSRNQKLMTTRKGARKGQSGGGQRPSQPSPEERVWQVVALIPAGRVASYGQVAALAGMPNHARFVGRTLRGPKLAPSISPGKTWSGFAGGLLFPTALACGFALWLGGTSVLGLTLAGAGLALASQIGDLMESAVKRRFNVKDSGRLLPGHGGLLDRADGLIGAVLAAGCLAAIRDTVSPSQAILIWP